MASLFRRHLKKCKNKDKGRGYTKCNCPIWADLRAEGQQRILKSTGLRNWAKAEKKLAEWEMDPQRAAQGVQTVASAVAEYLTMRETSMKGSTHQTYVNTLGVMSRYFDDLPLASLNMALLTKFHKSRSVAASTARKEIEHVRTFYKHALKNKWVTENPALDVEVPVQDRRPTLPFTDSEIEAMLAACDELTDDNPGRLQRTRDRARATILVMLYTGFRISDVIQLKRSKVDLKTGQILIRVMKTGIELYSRIPQEVIGALKVLAVESEYFLWSGTSGLQFACHNARRTINRVAAIAKVTNAHPHRFRDTFAVELLNNGCELRTVQLLLGHTNVTTTEKYYAPFVQSSQKVIDSALEKLKFNRRKQET